MAKFPTFQRTERDGTLNIQLDEKADELRSRNAIENRHTFSQFMGRDEDEPNQIGGIVVVEVEDHTVEDGLQIIDVRFEANEDAIDLKWHPEVVNDEGEVVFDSTVSIEGIDSSKIELKEWGASIGHSIPSRQFTNNRLMPEEIFERYGAEIKDTLAEYATFSTRNFGAVNNPSQYKDPSQPDSIQYSELAKDPKALAEREQLSMITDPDSPENNPQNTRAYTQFVRGHNAIPVENTRYQTMPKVRLNQPPRAYGGAFPDEPYAIRLERASEERMKVRGEEFNSDADFEAKAEVYGLKEDSKYSFPKNWLQEELQNAMREVEPPFSKAEERLMVVTDNWNETTLFEVNNKLSEVYEDINHFTLFKVKTGDIYDKDPYTLRETLEHPELNPYALVDNAVKETTPILVEATRLDDPKHIKAVENTFRSIYEDNLLESLTRSKAASVQTHPSKRIYLNSNTLDEPINYPEYKEEFKDDFKQILDEFKEAYYDNQKQNTLSNDSNDLDELGVDVALMDVDTALAKMEDIMNNQAIDIADNTVDNTQTVDNDNDYDNFVPPPIGP